MGNIITKTQTEMMERQKLTMRENMDRQMRLMQANQMALQWERLTWMMGGYTIVLAGAFMAMRRNGKIPEVMMGPLVVVPLVMAYQ